PRGLGEGGGAAQYSARVGGLEARDVGEIRARRGRHDDTPAGIDDGEEACIGARLDRPDAARSSTVEVAAAPEMPAAARVHREPEAHRRDLGWARRPAPPDEASGPG